MSDIGDRPRAAACGCEPWDSYDLHDSGCRFEELEAQIEAQKARILELERVADILRADTFHHHPDDVSGIERLEAQLKLATDALKHYAGRFKWPRPMRNTGPAMAKSALAAIREEG